MDGAVVLSTDGTRITRAATHLMPDPTIPTEEAGTRHRTAQRVARQTGFPVISVSQSMRIISLYVDDRRYVLDSSAELLSRANQAIATLERYKARLDEVSNALSALEIEDLVTVRDAVMVSQRLEMVRRIADEVTGQVVELGTDGRLLALQLDELMGGVDADRELIVRDYLPTGRRAKAPEQVLDDLAALSATELLDLTQVARTMALPSTPEGLESAVSPRGHRLLARVPRIPPAILDRVVEHFGGLQKLLAASVEDLQVVEGVGETRARAVREGISRLAEVSIIDRFS
jgi:diadenylate cyclase